MDMTLRSASRRAGRYPRVAGTLAEALAALKADHEFLLKGDVFTEDVIEKWIEYKTGSRSQPGADVLRLKSSPFTSTAKS
ncbi:MAG: hypothetical protein R2864_04855 [Syntrophotaleaceae bacterium]